MLCFKTLTLYGDPRHNSHRGRISRINEWTGTCRSVGWAWVCRGNKPPWCGGVPMYSDPDYPYLADKASLPFSSYFPFFSGKNITQYNIALYMYLHRLSTGILTFRKKIKLLSSERNGNKSRDYNDFFLFLHFFVMCLCNTTLSCLFFIWPT